MSQPARSLFDELFDRYGPTELGGPGELGPELFIQEIFGTELDQWQIDVARAFGRGERRISIRACHGPGKTFLAAALTVYQLICRFPQHVVATAPSRGQLEDALVKEVQTLFTKLPEPLRDLFEVKKNRIVLRAAPDESFFNARTARAEKPEALQGVHCEEGWVLLIADEASGIEEPIYESAAGSMSGERVTTILLSNPTRTSGTFYDTHNALADMWFTVKVGAADSPRVTDDFVEDIARRYGRESNAFRVRVLGEFPLAEKDTCIPWELVEAARTRDIEIPKDAPVIWGLDVARFGDDSSVLVKRSKIGVSPDMHRWHGMDTMQVVGKVKRDWDTCPPHERPDQILVDAIGLGAGVVDRLREVGLPARAVNVSETATDAESYRNLRSELWFLCREWLESRTTKLPDCECNDNECIHNRLYREMVAPKYDVTSSGKIMVESKSDMKKRNPRLGSPDVADALMLTFASEPARILQGSDRGDWGYSWNQPITRNLSVV